MRHGTKLATAMAVALTVFSGIAAVGATTGLLTSGPEPTAGKLRLVDQAIPERRGNSPTAAPGGAEPSGVSQTASSSGPGGVASGPTVGAAGSAPISAPLPTTAMSSGTSAAPAPVADDETEPSPPPPTSAPTTPVVDPGPAALDCHGSDDGMSEAQKKARERACEEEHDDD